MADLGQARTWLIKQQKDSRSALFSPGYCSVLASTWECMRQLKMLSLIHELPGNSVELYPLAAEGLLKGKGHPMLDS